MLIPVIPVMPVLRSILEIFGFMIIGGFAAKRNYLREADTTRLSKLIVDFFLPMLIFNSIVSNLQKESINDLWILPILGFFMVFTGFILGFFFRKIIKNKDQEVIKTFHYLLTINNFTFLPVILVSNIWGEVLLANLFLFNLGFQIAYWTIGVSILNGRHPLRDVRNLFSPSLIAIIVSLLVVFFDLKIYVPELFMTIFKKGGGVTIPLIMVTIGASVYYTRISFPDRDMLKLIILRLVIFPAIFIALLSLLPETSYMVIPLIVALMPVPVSSVVLTRRFGGSPAFAGEAAVYTTFFSLFTVPGWLYVLNSI